MKQYTFEITIKEGNDEFWEEIKGSGCSEVTELVKIAFANQGMFFDGENCEIKLKSFKDE